ncbi:hypothetical protein MSAN_02063100 [Mycena sanguinolenta]|uniref:Uncharacterized protein n=1 Tax=Mycena sanguinolenta TaxID=230812 RepID=A0A8H7CMN8_9AGAR|nr:hypothetical protein MSAN_02063100 [Mycena sanguinolenta]
MRYKSYPPLGAYWYGLFLPFPSFLFPLWSSRGMTANVAIVDESDSLVTYVGTWVTGGVPVEFKETTKVSPVQGSTASFTFEGTSIGVYATVAAVNPPDATVVFVVDNSISGTYTPPGNMTSDIHHQELWTSPTLADGTHTLVITQTQAQQAGVIFFDYFLLNTSSTAVKAYFVDDTDERIQYSAGWNQFASEADFGHSLHGSSAAGDSFSFQFEGKSISMWGAITNGSSDHAMNASMTIDGSPAVFFVPPIQTGAVTSNNLMFDSGELSNGTHTLVVTAENNYTVWLDYFLVAPATATTSSPAFSASGSTSHSHSSLNIAPIVGAAVGGTVEDFESQNTLLRLPVANSVYVESFLHPSARERLGYTPLRIVFQGFSVRSATESRANTPAETAHCCNTAATTIVNITEETAHCFDIEGPTCSSPRSLSTPRRSTSAIFRVGLVVREGKENGKRASVWHGTRWWKNLPHYAHPASSASLSMERKVYGMGGWMYAYEDIYWFPGQ